MNKYVFARLKPVLTSLRDVKKNRERRMLITTNDCRFFLGENEHRLLLVDRD